MSNENDWLYDYIAQYIKSPTFRNEIKDFVDENCSTFSGDTENSFQQSALHNEFKLLIENLLEKMLQEIGGSQEGFLLAAKKGLESEHDKKYFEQLIACENYLYFKSMMTKRNMQLEELAMKMMAKDSSKETKIKDKENPIDDLSHPLEPKEFTVDDKWKEMQKKREDVEMECAIQMSLALEEEKRKLMEIEDDDLRKAIELSKLITQQESNKNQIQQTATTTFKSSNPTNTNSNTVTPSVVPSSHFSISSTPKVNTFNPVNNISSGANLQITSSQLKQEAQKEKIVVNNINNTWKVGLNKGGNIDIAFYGNPENTNEKQNEKLPEGEQKRTDYVDVIIEKTEKLQFENDNGNKKNHTHSPQDSFTNSNNVGQIQNGNNANLIDLGSFIPNVNPNISTIIKPEQKEKLTSSISNLTTENGKLNNNSLPINSSSNLSESFTINDNINFNNQNLNFGQSSNTNTNTNTINSSQPTTYSTKKDEVIIDDVLDNSQSSSKINLGSLKDKKSFTGDRNFILNDKKDYSGVQSKIDTGIRTKASVSIPISDPSVNDELAKKYEQIEKEKQDKLKDYRDLILKMKKDKRSVEKEKVKEKDTNQFEIKDDQLSDEVKKRLEMRKQLADRLKK